MGQSGRVQKRAVETGSGGVCFGRLKFGWRFVQRGGVGDDHLSMCVVIGAGDTLPALTVMLPPVPLLLASVAWMVWPVDNFCESKEKILHKE